MDNKTGTPGISEIINPVEKDLGGFSVRRYLPHRLLRRVGPFVFFDHMGPADFPAGTGIDVRPHPHIGLSTITYLFDGEIMHRDSLGYVQAITPGAVNWMTAGRGIVHSERTGDEARQNGQRLHGLQVWVGLPEDAEEVAPEFFHYESDSIPRVVKDGIDIRVVVGEAFGAASPVKTYSPLFYVDVDMQAGASIQLPDTYPERAIHVAGGKVNINGSSLSMYDMAIAKASAMVEISAEERSRVVLFGGEAMNHRHVWWNFVSSSRDKIEAAKNDWKNNRFDHVPGETEFIPLPE